jgi:RNA polymerase sigma factor (sigma-70 family)
LALRIGSAAQASEIADQAFIRVLELPHPERVANLKAYVYRIASNIAAERAHTAAVHRRIQGILAYEAENADPSPQSLWLEEERLETLRRVLETLPPRVRWALRMRFWDNFQYSEITKLLQQRGVVVNLRTVQRWVAYGLECCREEFQRREGGTVSEKWGGTSSKVRRRNATRWFVEDESADEMP